MLASERKSQTKPTLVSECMARLESIWEIAVTVLRDFLFCPSYGEAYETRRHQYG
jgi:hypothetical protein